MLHSGKKREIEELWSSLILWLHRVRKVPASIILGILAKSNSFPTCTKEGVDLSIKHFNAHKENSKAGVYCYWSNAEETEYDGHKFREAVFPVMGSWRCVEGLSAKVHLYIKIVLMRMWVSYTTGKKVLLTARASYIRTSPLCTTGNSFCSSATLL